MKIFTQLLSVSLFLFGCSSTFSNQKKVRLFTQKRAPSSLSSCKISLKRVLGLVPETASANTIVVSYQEGVYGKAILEILDNLDDNTKIILVIAQNFEDLEILKRIKSRPNVTTIDFDTHGSVWARDWVPQRVIREDGSIEYISLKYYAVDVSHLSATKFTDALGLKHYESWLEGEMGNIMVDGQRRLFTTEKILSQNISERKGITKKMIINELKKAFGVNEVHILPEHPRDGGIGHIDLTAKYVGNIEGKETVLVSDSIKEDVKRALDKTASIFEELGFKVIRVEEYENKIRSGAPGFVNSLILNKKVYIPNYSKSELVEPENLSRLLELEKKARKVYEELGFDVIEIDSSAPIKGMGAVHCLTCTGNF